MNITIAVIVSTEKKEGQTRYKVRTIAPPIIHASDVLLKTALQRLSQQARRMIQSWIDSGNMQNIENWSYDPSERWIVFKERISLRDRTVKLKTLVLERRLLGQKFGYAPLLDEFLFQIGSNSSLGSQALAAITSWCRKKWLDLGIQDFSPWYSSGELRLEALDLYFEASPQKTHKKRDRIGALLGQPNPGGAGALQTVGRCLDAYTTSLPRLVGRDYEAERLEQLLASRRRQGVLLVGPSATGKTAVLEEVVRRRVNQRSHSNRHEKQVWLIAPGRVISGMSYLGEWEERWLTILKEAYKRDHVLYFDDPIGLYTAGMSRDSDLCLADVLKAFVAEHPVRMVWELTGDALSLLRRRDRALADQMIPLRVEPMSESATLSTLVEVVAQIEAERNCFLEPSIIPALIENSNLVAPQQSMPGRVISLARGLVQQVSSSAAAEGEDSNETQARVVTSGDLDEYIKHRTGLRTFLRMRVIDRAMIERILSSQIVGQSRAVEVLAAYANRALQRLSPPDRPLGVFLFTGPTGVGKTESAKALTRFLFHDETRLIRIDLNEVTSAEAAEGLIGTMANPDGRIPSAVRRQPNCVLLLDEIEKAHPDVLDYLLQVIGEGRLSDARGRTVDFRNTFIIMTSNLGSQESMRSLGYELSESQSAAERRQQVFLDVAKRTFRAEFLNRIDEIVVFQNLEKSHMGHIVSQHLNVLKQRDGLARRRTFLHVTEAAKQHIIERGFSDTLGARAIKRAVEREVAQPLADQLASIRIENPVWIRIATDNDAITCHATELEIVRTNPRPTPFSLQETLARATALLDRLSQELSERAPSHPSSSSRLTTVPYYAMRTIVGDAIEERDRIQEMIVKRGSLRSTIKTTRTAPTKTVLNSHRLSAITGERQAKQSDIKMIEGIQSLTHSENPLSDEEFAQNLTRKCILADATYQALQRPCSYLVRTRYLGPHHEDLHDVLVEGQTEIATTMIPARILKVLKELLIQEQFTVRQWTDKDYFVVEGVGIAAWVESITGTYQREPVSKSSILVLVEAIPVDENATDEMVRSAVMSMTDPVTELPNNTTDPHPWTQIRGRVGYRWTDSETGLSSELSKLASVRNWIIDLMPTPKEFTRQEVSHVSE